MSTDAVTVTDTPGIDTGRTTRIRPVRRRVRFPLVLKIFLVTALTIIFVVGLAVGVTIQRANAIANVTVNEAISSATSLFKDLERKRIQELKLGAITVARDPAFFAYIEAATAPAQPPQEAISIDDGGAPAGIELAPDTPQQPAPAPVADTRSIVDQLQQRRETLGSNLLLVTDVDGIVLGRTDGKAPGEDLYETQPLVKGSIESGSIDPVAGVIQMGGKLYHAAVAPLKVGVGPSPGFLLNAYEIDGAFANQIAKTTQTSAYFVPAAGSQAPAAGARSTNAPPGVSPGTVPQIGGVVSSGKMMPPRTITFGSTRYVMTAEPLSAGGKPLGVAVFLRSLDRELAPFREIERTMLMAGGVALLLAFIFSWLFAKRLTRPIEQLVATAESVTDGNYDIHPAVERGDEVGVLSRAFAQMVSSLRDKAELEELYHEMQTKVAERDSSPQTFQPAQIEEGTILVTDLRGAMTASGDATTVIERVGWAMRLQESEVRRHDGVVREIVGHRLVSVFSGERSSLRAIRAARAVCEEIAARTADAPLMVGAGIASGDFYTGSVDLDQESGTALIGNAPLLALLFAWEAPNNTAFISLETAQSAQSDILSSATREEVRLRWLPAPVSVVSFPLTNVATGVLPRMSATAAMPTMRVDSSMPVIQAPGHDLTVGSRFADRYLIEQVIGRGGMGVVYRALDTQLDETVAIKTLPGDVMSRSPEELERFKREIRLARKITHRNVLRTFDYGQAEGVYFISMEFIRGYTLAELIEENPRMAPRLAMSITRQITRGLEVAHEEGIIHRDIKPQNVLVDQKGQVKLMDFGIARMAESPNQMTAAGLIVGTPHYMSPEQVQGKALDARSDVYSMGILMYEMLCGIKPFDSPSLTAVLTAHITEKVKAPIEIRPEIGQQINRIILRCLEKEPAKRYANGAELLAELDRLQAAAAA
jgi:HAMP domain-containing protein/predicted Ser/Thr protein kinase